MYPCHFFLTVCFARLKFFFVGAPLVPTFRIFSPLPAAILLLLACIFLYKLIWLILSAFHMSSSRQFRACRQEPLKVYPCQILAALVMLHLQMMHQI